MNELFYSRLNTIVSFTIAFLTLFTALLGWQMGNIAGNAASAYDQAKQAELNLQQVESTSHLKAFEDQRAFLDYKDYFEQFKLVSAQLETASKADPRDDNLVAQLTSKRDEFQLLYLSSLKLVNKDFISRDGTYNLNEQLGQLTASAARQLDIDPAPHNQTGQAYDAQVGKVQIALVLLAGSLFFFAITSTVEGVKGKLQLLLTFLGYAAAIAGLVIGITYWN